MHKTPNNLTTYTSMRWKVNEEPTITQLSKFYFLLRISILRRLYSLWCLRDAYVIEDNDVSFITMDTKLVGTW